MGAELGTWLELAREEGGAYLDWLVNALLRPRYIGEQAVKWTSRPSKKEGIRKSSEIPAPLLTILVMSVFVGATIGSIIPDRPPVKDRATVAVVVLMLWVLVSLIVHAIIRMLRGHGSVAATLMTMLQLLALAYVFSNVVALLTVSALQLVSHLSTSTAVTLPIPPGEIILGTQLLMLFIYLPFSLHRVHGIAAFGGLGLIGTCLVAFVAVLLGTLTMAVGGC